jgi:predicted RNase H-like nuclease (RuvC/YqgF family)
METELVSLRADVDMRKQREAVLEWEIDSLKKLLTATTTERDTYRRRADSIKVLLDQTGAALVSGIQKYHASEREIQEQTLVTQGEQPIMITNAQKALQETMN